jgi:hypothetical protein
MLGGAGHGAFAGNSMACRAKVVEVINDEYRSAEDSPSVGSPDLPFGPDLMTLITKTAAVDTADSDDRSVDTAEPTTA